MSLEGHGWAGRTLNPYNRNLTSGGSSAGEGALLALRGSALGLGSDIGGSGKRHYEWRMLQLIGFS